MRLIDEKGRLFGLVNIIDLSIVLIIVVGIFVMHQGYKQVKANREETPEHIKDLYIKVLLIDVPEYIVNSMKVGDREAKVGEIVKIEKTPIVSMAVPRGLQDFYPRAQFHSSMQKPEELLDYNIMPKMVVTFKVRCYLKQNTIFVSGSQRTVRIGREFPFSTYEYEVEGVVIEIEGAS